MRLLQSVAGGLPDGLELGELLVRRYRRHLRHAAVSGEHHHVWLLGLALLRSNCLFTWYVHVLNILKEVAKLVQSEDYTRAVEASYNPELEQHYEDLLTSLFVISMRKRHSAISIIQRAV